MAAPLRYPLILLAWGAMAAIYLPLLPAAGELVGAARSPAHWRALFADPQLGQALAATLVSTLLSVGGALLIALTIVAALWPSARWRRLASRLPLLLAVPHLALATAALLLFAEGGWLWQQLPFLTPPVDRYGIGLGLTMALKESAFVLWVIYGLLGEKRPRRPGDPPEEPSAMAAGSAWVLAGAARPAARPRHGAAGHHRLEPVGGRCSAPGAGARQSAPPRRAGVAMVKPGR